MDDMRNDADAVHTGQQSYRAPSQVVLVSRNADDTDVRRGREVFNCTFRTLNNMAVKRHTCERHADCTPSRVSEVGYYALSQSCMDLLAIQRGRRFP